MKKLSINQRRQYSIDNEDFNSKDNFDVHRIKRSFVSLTFLYITIDPFAAYKHEDLGLKKVRKVYQQPLLQLPVTCSDRLRECWWNWQLLMCSAFCTKNLLTAALTYTLIKDSQLFKLKQNNLELYDGLENLRYHLGDCLLATPDLSILVHGFIGAFSLIVICFLPYYYAKRPIDLLPVRFFLKPYHEIRRIDTTIEAKFDFIQNFLIFRSQMSGSMATQTYNNDETFIHRKRLPSLNNLLTSSNLFEPLKTESSIYRLDFDRIANQLRSLDALRHYRWQFRPAFYSLDNYEGIASTFARLMALFYLMNIMNSLIIWPLLYQFLTSQICAKKKIMADQCTFRSAFGYLEIFDICQVIYLLLQMFCHYSTMNIMIVVMAKYQFDMIDTLKSDLEESLDKLRHINKYSERYKKRREDFVDNLLTETLIKQQLFEDHMEQSIDFLTECLTVIMINNVIAVTMSSIYKTLKLSFSNLDNVLFIVVWAYLDYLLLICAIFLAKLNEIKKLDYSILAETYQHAIQSNLASPNDSLAALWRRIVFNFRVEERFSISPFGIKLNYQTMLSINFVLISLASVIKSI